MNTWACSMLDDPTTITKARRRESVCFMIMTVEMGG